MKRDRRPGQGAATTRTVNKHSTRDRDPLDDFATARRLRRLPEQCRLLLGGLHNDEGDAELVFADVSFAEAFRAASSDVDVWEAFSRLAPDFWR